MILLYFGWFFNKLWKFWTFGESLTLLGFINRYILGKGSQAVATLIGFFSFYLLMVFHITSAHFYCILSKNYNHSKCVQNIVFYAGWQLNGNDLCKKPCQINTFQVSKSDINAEMQEMDYIGWVEFTLYIETIVISYLLRRKKMLLHWPDQAEISVSNVVTVPGIEMISECPTQLENIEALPSQYSVSP